MQSMRVARFWSGRERLTKFAMRWKTKGRLVRLIVDEVRSRGHNGEAYMH